MYIYSRRLGVATETMHAYDEYVRHFFLFLVGVSVISILCARGFYTVPLVLPGLSMASFCTRSRRGVIYVGVQQIPTPHYARRGVEKVNPFYLLKRANARRVENNNPGNNNRTVAL